MGNRKSDLNGGPLGYPHSCCLVIKMEEAGKFCLEGCELSYQFFCFQWSYTAIAILRIFPVLGAWLKNVGLFLMCELE